jgi:MATE family multidrug resistance protein
MEKPDNQKTTRATYIQILVLAGPMILTMSSQMLMQFVDTFMLSRFSTNAVAASMPAGMASWLIISLFQGTAGYTSSLASQYEGAGRRDRVSATVWQGIYFSIFSGVLIALCGLAGPSLFAFVGHEPAVMKLEAVYFSILCFGAPVGLAGSAVSGFFTSTHRTGIILTAQISGAIVNFLLDLVLIFGLAGFPRLGIAGAALATVAGQAAITLVLLTFFFLPSVSNTYRTWQSRKFVPELFLRLIRFGFPNGIRMCIEMTGWTAFLFYVGRIGIVEMTATNIAWRINGISFFPVIGLGIAVGILVGNAQGRRDFAESARVTRMGVIMSEVWMAAGAMVFLLFPKHLFMLFYDPNVMAPEFLDSYLSMSVVLLRLVALYCVVDSFNFVILGALQAAGDTRWTLIASIIMFGSFIGVMTVADKLKPGFYTEWIIMTGFVFAFALIWLWRFMSGKWKMIEVIEHGPE